MQFRPSFPSTQARRLSLVLGLLLIVAAYVLVVAMVAAEGHHVEWAAGWALNYPPPLLLVLWSIAAALILASFWWDLTAGLVARTISRLIQWVRTGS